MFPAPFAPAPLAGPRWLGRVCRAVGIGTVSARAVGGAVCVVPLAAVPFASVPLAVVPFASIPLVPFAPAPLAALESFASPCTICARAVRSGRGIPVSGTGTRRATGASGACSGVAVRTGIRAARSRCARTGRICAQCIRPFGVRTFVGLDLRTAVAARCVAGVAGSGTAIAAIAALALASEPAISLPLAPLVLVGATPMRVRAHAPRLNASAIIATFATIVADIRETIILSLFMEISPCAMRLSHARESIGSRNGRTLERFASQIPDTHVRQRSRHTF